MGARTYLIIELNFPKIKKIFWNTSQNYLEKTDNDFKTLQITMRHINKWIMNTNLGRLKLDKWLLDKEDYPALDELGGKGYHYIGGYHHMGGTRMGTNPERGGLTKPKVIGKVIFLYVDPLFFLQLVMQILHSH